MSSYIWPPNNGVNSSNAVTSLNSLTGALTLVAGTGVSVTPSGSNITIANTGVTALNTKTGAVVLVAGSNITLTPSGQNITIAASGGGGSGVDTIGTIDGNTASSDGLSISGTTLFAQSADVTNPGMVNNTTQSFSGNKTFTGTVGASNLSGTNTGDLTLAAVGSSPSANGASLSGQVLTLQPFDGTHPGVVTASGGGTSNFLRADGSWATPPGGGGSGTVTSVDMTVPAFLSIGGNPITTSGTLAVTLSGTALPTANGGTNVTSSGTAGNVLVSNGSDWISAPFSGSSAFAAYASSQVTTISTVNTSATFATFSNSPAFTFIPTITGTYKVYSSLTGESSSGTSIPVFRIFNTTGGAILLQESQAIIQANINVNPTAQSVYTLTAGVTYVFDIQGKETGSGGGYLRGDLAPFYMFAEGISLPGNGIATGWTAYTPSFTGLGTVSVQTFWYKINGDSIFIKGRFTTGTPTAALAQISLPGGYTIEPTKVNSTSELCGYMTTSNLNTAAFTVLAVPSVTHLVFDFNSDTNGGLTTGGLGNVVFAGGVDYSFSTTAIPVT